MFGDINPYEDAIRRLLQVYSLEELLEVFDITEERVLTILLEGGHCELPGFVVTPSIETNEDEEQG